MEIIALACSRHATEESGPLRCVGHFRSAINFLTPEQALLTLHRTGRGLSPMGWEIDDDDFDEIADALADSAGHSSCCRLTPAGIELADISVRRSVGKIDLSLSAKGEIAVATLYGALSATAAETGLSGRLDQLIDRPPSGEIALLQRQFGAWLRGETVDWSLMLGKGPGLTPANDDTILGMLFCAWFDRRINAAALPPFFSGSRVLDELTTLVSLHYLRFAAQGIFATPLHQLAAALSGADDPAEAVGDLLKIGHSSGADTLLGIWCGASVINSLY